MPDPRNAGESADPLLHEVIRQLSELRQQTGDVVVRLTRIEANSVHGDIERLRAELAAERARVDALMRDKDRRDGAIGAAAWLHKSGPWAFLVGAALTVAAWFKAPA